MDKISEVTLDKMKFHISHAFPFSLSGDEIFITRTLPSEFQVDIEILFFGHALEGTTIKYPLTWWDAFKDRWFGPFLVKRWPVNYRKHDISFRVFYPDFRPAMPKQRYVVHVRDYETTETTGDDE